MFIFFVLLLGVPFDFEIDTPSLFFSTYSSLFVTISSTCPFMVASRLPSTFSGICNPITSNYASWNNWKLLKFIVINEDPCHMNCGWFHIIVGFQNHCHLTENFCPRFLLVLHAAGGKPYKLTPKLICAYYFFYSQSMLITPCTSHSCETELKVLFNYLYIYIDKLRQKANNASAKCFKK